MPDEAAWARKRPKFGLPVPEAGRNGPHSRPDSQIYRAQRLSHRLSGDCKQILRIRAPGRRLHNTEEWYII